MLLRCLTNDATLVQAVKKLNLGVLPVQPPAFCYRRAEHDQYGLSWAAIQENGLLSGAVIADLEMERGVRTVQIRTLVVLSHYRRQGIGKQLIAKIIEQTKAIEHKITSLRLHVHTRNDEALAFYKALGFIETAQVDNYYRHLEPRTAFVLEYSLH